MCSLSSFVLLWHVLLVLLSVAVCLASLQSYTLWLIRLVRLISVVCYFIKYHVLQENISMSFDFILSWWSCSWCPSAEDEPVILACVNIYALLITSCTQKICYWVQEIISESWKMVDVKIRKRAPKYQTISGPSFKCTCVHTCTFAPY